MPDTAATPTRRALATLVASSWRIVYEFRALLAAAERALPAERIRQHHDQPMDRVRADAGRNLRAGTGSGGQLAGEAEACRHVEKLSGDIAVGQSHQPPRRGLVGHGFACSSPAPAVRSAHADSRHTWNYALRGIMQP
jgi:hypothetical protein